MRVCAALCSRQRGLDWYPWVIVSLDELSELAGWKPYVDSKTGQSEPNHGCLNRAVRRLEKAGLILTETVPGVVSGKAKRRATVYRLGRAAGGSIVTPQAGSIVTPQADIIPIQKGVDSDPPDPSGTTYPQGIGERTVALTGDPTPISPQPAAISPSRFRALLGRLNPVNHAAT